ncbi:MAG: hypothetical protein WC867_08325 [Candidatus Pacearchaeota archaeon]|jgi:hypothetical protein
MNRRLTSRNIALSATAGLLTLLSSGCFHIVGNKDYDDFRLAQSGYAAVSLENTDIKEQLVAKDEQIEELTIANETALGQIKDYKNREVPEQTRLRYERNVTSLETDLLRLQKEKLLLEKKVVEYETTRIDKPINPEIMKLKERIASLETEVSSYKIEFEKVNRENNELRNDNPEVQYLKELTNKLQIQNSKYRTLIDSYNVLEKE